MSKYAPLAGYALGCLVSGILVMLAGVSDDSLWAGVGVAITGIFLLAGAIFMDLREGG